jgi:hypothetical protein
VRPTTLPETWSHALRRVRPRSSPRRGRCSPSDAVRPSRKRPGSASAPGPRPGPSRSPPRRSAVQWSTRRGRRGVASLPILPSAGGLSTSSSSSSGLARMPWLRSSRRRQRPLRPYASALPARRRPRVLPRTARATWLASSATSPRSSRSSTKPAASGVRRWSTRSGRPMPISMPNRSCRRKPWPTRRGLSPTGLSPTGL